MKSGIEMFGLLWVFAFIVMVIPSLLGFAIDYKQTNEASSLVVEIIEVNDGINDESRKLIEDTLSEYEMLEVDITKKNVGNNKYVYAVKMIKEFNLALLDLKYDIVSQKISKGVNG